MKYIAVTTGPIARVMNAARSTRAIWNASYLFSFQMKQLVKRLQGEYEFILPYFNDELLNGKNRAGFFHDQLVLVARDEQDHAHVQGTISEVNREIAKLLSQDLNITEPDAQFLVDHLFRTCVTELNMPDGENPMPAISTVLNNLELRPNYTLYEKQNLLKQFLELRQKNRFRNFLIRDAYPEEELKNLRFESVAEVALADSIQQVTPGDYWKIFGEEHAEETIFAKLTDPAWQDQYPAFNNLKQYHKYFAVVSADADNLGSLIQKLYELTGANRRPIATLSEALFDFDREALKIIEAYYGLPVFLGGDDLVALVPVRFQNGSIDEDVFQLCRKLNDAFENIILKRDSLQPAFNQLEKTEKTSLSFGVAITFYKYPLQEALEISYNQLQKAKDKPLGKNAIAFKVLKHSGKYFEGRISQLGQVYHSILGKLIRYQFREERNESSDAFVSALQYKLELNKEILKELVRTSGKPEQQDRIDFFFDKQLKRESNANNAFVDFVKDLLQELYKEGGDSEKALQITAALLRYVQFINQKFRDE